ncbi:MAG TPA: carbohydrate porin [Thermoanaerobaculia bacterium]|nr:carbohydrate porin [Thermoanaerobaculia bacterium]
MKGENKMKPGALAVSAAALALALGMGAWSPAHAGDVTISGKFYGDVTSKTNKDEASGQKSSDSGFGTDVKRFYVSVNYKYDSIWSANFTSDIGDKNHHYDLFVKKAYIQAKLSDAAMFRLGSADMPWIPYIEDLYGYRYVENTLLDRLHFGNSADWGVAFQGKHGIVDYQVSMVNGRGYADPSRSKGEDFEGRIGFKPVKGLTIAIGGYSGKRGLDTDTAPAAHTATRVDGVIAYMNEHFRVGAEYFTAENWTTVTSSAKDKADGFSGWFSVPVKENVAVFGRYDSAKPSKDLNPGSKDKYFNLGVQLHPNKALLVAFAYKHEEVDSGLGGKVNGVGSDTPGSKGKSDEIGVWTQFKW